MEHPIFSIAQLEEKLKLYRDGILSDTEMRLFCSQVGLPPNYKAEPRPAPSEKTRLKHEAKYLRRELRKIHNLQVQRLKVEQLKRKLDDLQYEEQHRGGHHQGIR